MLLTLSCRNFRLLSRCFCQQSKPSLRTTNLSINESSKPVLLNKSNYRIIYDFPHIKYVGAFIKTKRSVPIISVSLAPILYYLDESRISPFILVISAGIYFLFGTAVTKLTRNTVGKMYVNKEGDISDVMISSLNALGRRIDRIHAVKDIINVDFPSPLVRKLGFVQIGLENSDVYYNLNIHNCKFIDENACDYILGARFGPPPQDSSAVK